MRASHVLLLAVAILASQRASAQTAPTDSAFVTGSCPTRSAATVNWDAVVTAPEQRARIVPITLPRFPEHLRHDGYRGRVVVAMVIDTAGRVMPGTVSISESSDAQLSAWGCTVAFNMRFLPATVGGKAVNALSEQPLSYNARPTRIMPPE